MICNISQRQSALRGHGARAAGPHQAARYRQAISILCLLALALTITGCGRADARAIARLGARRRARSLGVLFTAPPV